MIRIVKSIVTIVAVAAIATTATGAYFSDTETSTGNTITAGTLDLNLDGGNTNVVKFAVTDMKPGDTKTGMYAVANAGSISGYLDLESIAVSSDDNLCNEPETNAGDVTCGVGDGELAGLVNLQIYSDADLSGTYTAGDVLIYNGLASSIAASYDANIAVAAAATKNIIVDASWASSANDNMAQTDSLNLNMTFELAQTTAQ